MARTAGAENRRTPKDSESIFFDDAVAKFSFWKKRAKELKDAGEKCDLELKYAEAYILLLNKFSQRDE